MTKETLLLSSMITEYTERLNTKYESYKEYHVFISSFYFKINYFFFTLNFSLNFSPARCIFSLSSLFFFFFITKNKNKSTKSYSVSLLGNSLFFLKILKCIKNKHIICR